LVAAGRMKASMVDGVVRSHMNKVLEDAETQFRECLDRLPVGAAIVGLDYRFRHCNRVFCAMLGYSEAELVGKSTREVTYPDDAALDIVEGKAIVPGSDEPMRMVKRYVRKGGDVAWVELGVSVTCDSRGAPSHFVYVATDITARKETEDALRESEATLQAIFRSSHLATCVAKDGLHLYVNPAYARLLGYDAAAELVGKPILEAIAPECRPQIEEVARNRMRGVRTPGFYEVRAVRKDGSQFLMEVDATTFLVDEEMFTLAVVRDVTEYKKAQTALAMSEERFSKVFAMCPESIVIARFQDGVYVDVNEAFLKMTGYRREDAVGRTRTDLRFWADETDLKLFLKALTAKGRIRGHDMRYRTKTGKIRDGLVSSEMVEIDGVPHSLSFVVDVTRKRVAERKLQRAHAELEKRVAARTAELQTAIEEIESFSYSVSHDLRAPLRTLDGFSRILLEDYSESLDEEGRYTLTRICEAAGRMGLLVDSLLALGRINRAELRRHPVDLSAMAEDVVRKLREEEPERSVVTVIAPQLRVVGDPVLLRSMMENLFGNAWKYTSKKPEARIEFGRCKRGQLDAFFVRDDGAGFDMAHAGDLFGTFRRLHSESEYSGIGVGLATVRRIVRRHGGEIWAEAAPGQGATFYFTIETEA
jgi:PAS domain S-box-containing protein